MADPAEILRSFAPISLGEMEKVEFMNRKDTKYFFDIEKLPRILSALQPNYKNLEIGNCRIFHYRNIYFDTPDFFCYYQHHNKRVNRYKIRIRQYVESNLNFLEVKFKTNTKHTVKTRMVIPSFSEILSPEAIKFLEANTPYDPRTLLPVLRNDFKRFTLVSNDLTERATLDTDLMLMVGDETRYFKNLCIAELKHEGSSSGSLFKLIMRESFCPEMRISKYSVGAAYMYDHLKQNNWKPKKIRINRIENV